MTEYIIVGAGLGGIAFAEHLLQNDKTAVVFEDESQNSSRIAGGLYNPIILKRFSAVFEAAHQLSTMKSFYAEIKARLGVQHNQPTPVLRKFYSVEEQNNWFTAADKPALSAFLSINLFRRKFSGIDSPFDFGEVLETGWVDTQALLRDYHSDLINRKMFLKQQFDYSKLEQFDDHVQYGDLKARHVVFCEGFGVHQNPFFNFLPLQGTKGELFIIDAPDLDLDVIVNTNVFILPLGGSKFKIGATYNWIDKTAIPTEDGREELIAKIKEILTCDFTILEHYAGVRPTVRDRKPLLGTHPEFSRMHVLNGLGTRGVMLAPAMAAYLYDHIEYQKPLQKEIDIRRFLS